MVLSYKTSQLHDHGVIMAEPICSRAERDIHAPFTETSLQFAICPWFRLANPVMVHARIQF
jgi:hypothetical protein